jgi:hypothetical protein
MRVTVLGIYSVAFDASTVVFPIYGVRTDEIFVLSLSLPQVCALAPHN